MRTHPYKSIMEYYTIAHCPHMPKIDGKYVVAEITSVIEYNGAKYEIKTCCTACANAIKNNPAKYIKQKDNNTVVAVHKDTNEEVQTLKKV
tara:strand:- start:340 stop:612 length:273 start_codon:yes stop_codon:yes gene_type:complete